MPNDDKELDRLDLHYHIVGLRLNGALHLALIGDDPGNILDLGTGTGIWAIDMGETYQGATVTGIDLSASQPEWVPPNVRFEIDDIEDEWTFRKPFHFIHCRYLACSVRNWHRLIEQCFQSLEPGGWVEFKDWDARPHNTSGGLDMPDNNVKIWHDLIFETCEEMVGATPHPALIIPDICRTIGFTNLKDRVFEVPVGQWPRDIKEQEIGMCYLSSLYDGASAISIRLLTRYRGWQRDEVDILNAKFREDLMKTQFYHK